MTFQDAVKTCFIKYADFKGRASRSEYWWFMLFLFLASLGLAMISPRLANFFSLATLLPSLAAGARRLHDSDRSGWWQLIWLVPVIGWIGVVYLMVQGPQEPNRFDGRPPLSIE